MNSLKLGMLSSLTVNDKLLSTLKFRNTLVEQLRFRKRTINLRKPVPHPERELVTKITKPKYVNPKDFLPIDELCSKSRNAKLALETKFVHPMDQIMGDEVRDKIMNARLVAIFHIYPKTGDQFFDLRVNLNKVKLTHLYHSQTIIRLALQGTKYEPLLKLYEMPSVTFVSPEAKFTKFMKLLKKYHFISLIGGVFENQIISVSDFKKLANNPYIEGYQSELSGLLAGSGQKLSSNLSQHQRELCSSLQRYIADKS